MSLACCYSQGCQGMGQPDSATSCIIRVGMTCRTGDGPQDLHFRLVKGACNLTLLLISELDWFRYGRCRDGVTLEPSEAGTRGKVFHAAHRLRSIDHEAPRESPGAYGDAAASYKPQVAGGIVPAMHQVKRG